MKKIILITFFFSSVSLSQTLHFESTFTFTDEFNNSQELILGYDAYGTNGFDPQLGEVVDPQVPPGNFGVRFQLPTDTSIYTTKDLRFGCGQPFYYEHLIDLSYENGSNIIDVFWDWEWPLAVVEFKNPFNGDILSRFEMFSDSTHFIIPPTLEKIIITAGYDGPITFPIFDLVEPNGGDTLVSGENYTITWWTNWTLFPLGDLEYSTDGGLSWNIIIDSISHQNSYNYYQWLVPNLSSDSCLIRVGEYPCYSDKSDSYFTITYPVNVEGEVNLPTEFSLSQNYPNPFNPTTSLQYAISSRQFVSLKVFDVLGNEIATLVNEEKSAGEYKVEFRAERLPSGIYNYQLKAGSFIQTKKMVLLK